MMLGGRVKENLLTSLVGTAAFFADKIASMMELDMISISIMVLGGELGGSLGVRVSIYRGQSALL